MRSELPLSGGSLVALATPFLDGALDEAALARMCERQVCAGTAALVVCGSTGEAAALTEDEQARAIRVAVATAAGRVPVIAGCSAAATDAAARLAATAVRHGADAVLSAAPCYVRPTQDGIAAHLRAVAHAADRPVMLYDIPGRTGVAIADATVAALFERRLIWALKDAAGDLGRVQRLRALCGAGLLQFGGDDVTAPAYRAIGGDGCVSVSANLVPALCAQLHAAWDRGNLPLFAATRDRLAPLHDALAAESNPIPVKAALAQLGLCGPQLRLPLTSATQATCARLAQVLEALMPAEAALGARPRLALAG